jgi:hypothetical protein
VEALLVAQIAESHLGGALHSALGITLDLAAEYKCVHLRWLHQKNTKSTIKFPEEQPDIVAMSMYTKTSITEMSMYIEANITERAAHLSVSHDEDRYAP